MQTMTLDQLKGMWISLDGQSTMWISDDLRKLVITLNRAIVLSEYTAFSYDEVQNVCIISDSVTLSQLFPDGDICIDVTINGGTNKIAVSRRQ